MSGFRASQLVFAMEVRSVVGAVDPPRSTPLSLLREAMADAHGVAATIFDAQSRLLRAA